jgi:hypothetical protein
MIVHFSKTRNEAMKRSSEGRCRKLCAGRRNNVYDAARTSLFPLLFGIDDAAWIVLRKWEVVELRALGRATSKLDDIVCRAGGRTMRTLGLVVFDIRLEWRRAKNQVPSRKRGARSDLQLATTGPHPELAEGPWTNDSTSVGEDVTAILGS